MKLWSLMGNSQKLDGGAMFGNAPRAMWSRWAAPDDANRIALACRALLATPLAGRTVLFEAGIGEDVQAETRPGEAAERRAALALARKRGFGPFGAGPPDRQRREKQIAAMLRAGHPLDSARELVDAASEEAAEQWAAEPDEEG